MIDIQAGDVVVCAHAECKHPVHGIAVARLVVGRAYRVLSAFPNPRCSVSGVGLVLEAVSPHPWNSWDAFRFRKVTKCDEDFTEFMKSIRPTEKKRAEV